MRVLLWYSSIPLASLSAWVQCRRCFLLVLFTTTVRQFSMDSGVAGIVRRLLKALRHHLPSALRFFVFDLLPLMYEVPCTSTSGRIESGGKLD
jgi:hypothetical protein